MEAVPPRDARRRGRVQSRESGTYGATGPRPSPLERREADEDDEGAELATRGVGPLERAARVSSRRGTHRGHAARSPTATPALRVSPASLTSATPQSSQCTCSPGLPQTFTVQCGQVYLRLDSLRRGLALRLPLCAASAGT